PSKASSPCTSSANSARLLFLSQNIATEEVPLTTNSPANRTSWLARATRAYMRGCGAYKVQEIERGAAMFGGPLVEWGVSTGESRTYGTPEKVRRCPGPVGRERVVGCRVAGLRHFGPIIEGTSDQGRREREIDNACSTKVCREWIQGPPFDPCLTDPRS